MWDQAEAFALLDREGCVTVVSRNEHEAPVSNVVGQAISDMLTPESLPAFHQAIERVLAGEDVEALLSGVADAGYVFWGRVRMMPSPELASPVLFHMRRLPTTWAKLSEREREVIHALNGTGMSPKRAAQRLDVSLNTLNAHRRSIGQKCELQGVGDFWIFVHQCR